MVYEWYPLWYGMDQSIVVGDEGLFFLKKNGFAFSASLLSSNDVEVKARINAIHHSQLGEIKGFLCDGFDYYLHTMDGMIVAFDSEEQAGEITDGPLESLDSYLFEVDMDIIEVTGNSSQSGFNQRGRDWTVAYWQKRRETWDSLLNR